MSIQFGVYYYGILIILMGAIKSFFCMQVDRSEYFADKVQRFVNKCKTKTMNKSLHLKKKKMLVCLFDCVLFNKISRLSNAFAVVRLSNQFPRRVF